MSMDKIYLPKTDNSIIHLEQRFRDYHDEIAAFPGLSSISVASDGDDDNATVVLPKLVASMAWPGTADKFVELSDSVSLDQLTHEDDLPVCRYDPSQYRPNRLSRLDMPTRAVATLRTLACLKEHTEQNTRGQRARLTRGRTKLRHVPVPVNVAGESDLQPGSELVVVLRIYAPFKYTPQSTARMRLLKTKQRIAVLGSQTLSELRDRIVCVCTSHGPFTDISQKHHPASSADDLGNDGEHANAAPAATRKRRTNTPGSQRRNKTPGGGSVSTSASSSSTPADSDDPGFFFITDTFYSDSRHRCDTDYTDPIREWADLHPQEVGPIEPVTGDMLTTRLADLRVRIGAPLVYQHRGNCEHVFTVADVRLLAAGDPLQRRHYPLVDAVLQRQRQSCDTCGLAEAAVVVCDSVQHVRDPAYLCDACFVSFHYVDGVKVGEFRAYAFVSNRETGGGADGGDVVEVAIGNGVE